jgi:hypothetical protein
MMETHRMELVRSLPDGADEWLCPICGRRVIMRTPPDYYRRVIEEGDSAATHSGSTDPRLCIDTTVIDDKPGGLDDPNLAPFQRWMQGRE